MNDEGERGLFAYYKISPKEQRTEYRFFCFQPLANERRFFVKLNNEVLFWGGGRTERFRFVEKFSSPFNLRAKVSTTCRVCERFHFYSVPPV